MRHFVLTRSVYDPAQCDPAMVERRLALFRAVTVPSIAAQSIEATWVLAVHRDDPFLAERVAAAESTGAPVMTVEMPSATGRVATAIAPYDSHWDLPDGMKLTTRLDDDDGLTADHFARLDMAVRGSPGRRAFVFPYGVRLSDARWAPYHHPRNMFCSLYTPDGDRSNVMRFRHRRIRDQVPTVDVDAEPAWCFVRHDDTISDGGRDHVSRPVGPALRRLFPFDWPALDAMWATS